MKAVAFLLIVLSLPSPAQLRIVAAGFKMDEQDLRNVFTPALAALPKADTFKDPPLFVSRHRQGPITLFERTPRGEVAIQLDCEDYYYSQIIYQFAHEVAHVRANFQPVSHENKWLEETLCETASLFVLRKLSNDWEHNAPNESLRNYRKHLATYASKVIQTRESLTPETSPAFYQKHRDTLRKSATERDLNGAFANLILPLLEKEPRHWKTLPRFPRIKGSTLAEHFATWRKAVPKQHHAFLKQLEALFLKK